MKTPASKLIDMKRILFRGRLTVVVILFQTDPLGLWNGELGEGAVGDGGRGTIGGLCDADDS